MRGWRMFFRPFGASFRVNRAHPRLAPWAAFFRRGAAWSCGAAVGVAVPGMSFAAAMCAFVLCCYGFAPVRTSIDLIPLGPGFIRAQQTGSVMRFSASFSMLLRSLAYLSVAGRTNGPALDGSRELLVDLPQDLNQKD